MFERRETGSILLAAPREQVFEFLLTQAGPASHARVEGSDRLEVRDKGMRSTFVLRDEAGGGTRLYHARSQRPGLREWLAPESLRESVESDLLRIQRLVERD